MRSVAGSCWRHAAARSGRWDKLASVPSRSLAEWRPVPRRESDGSRSNRLPERSGPCARDDGGTVRMPVVIRVGDDRTVDQPGELGPAVQPVDTALPVPQDQEALFAGLRRRNLVAAGPQAFGEGDAKMALSSTTRIRSCWPVLSPVIMTASWCLAVRRSAGGSTAAR